MPWRTPMLRHVEPLDLFVWPAAAVAASVPFFADPTRDDLLRWLILAGLVGAVIRLLNGVLYDILNGEPRVWIGAMRIAGHVLTGPAVSCFAGMVLWDQVTESPPPWIAFGGVCGYWGTSSIDRVMAYLIPPPRSEPRP